MERLLKYMFSQPPSITYNDILMVAMPHILTLNE